MSLIFSALSSAAALVFNQKLKHFSMICQFKVVGCRQGSYFELQNEKQRGLQDIVTGEKNKSNMNCFHCVCLLLVKLIYFSKP